jgi:hypothetical protein
MDKNESAVTIVPAQTGVAMSDADSRPAAGWCVA